MAGCNIVKYTGSDVPVYYHIACGDVLPSSGEWKPLMALRGKEVSISWDTIDATADDSVGALRDNIASYMSFTISGDGTLKNSGTGSAAVKELFKHILNPIATGGQPMAWLKIIFPDVTITAFMLLPTISRSAPYDDLATWSFEASAAPSDFGLIVEDTPEPIAVASVTVAPATAAVDIGDTTQLTATALPAGSPQSVTWTSSANGVAFVNSTGLVTGASAGTATITATSMVDPSKSATSVVTVS